MLSPLDGQLAARIVMNDLWHTVEGWAVLTQHILVLLGPRQFHVHEALAAPARRNEGRVRGVAGLSLPSTPDISPSLKQATQPWPCPHHPALAQPHTKPTT